MNILLRTLAIIAILGMCLPASAQMGRANKDYELGAYNLAVRGYLEVLEKRPANHEAMAKLADSYRYLNQMEEARSWYEKLIKERKLSDEHIFHYAEVLMALTQYEKARQWFLEYGRLNKDQAVKANHFAQSCSFAANQIGQSSPYLVSNEFINTTASDFGPSLYGDQIVFSSARTDMQQPGASWTGKANNQLFMARVGNNGFLEAVVPVQSRLREDFVNVGPVAYGPNNKEVVYTKNNFIDGTRHIPTGGLELSLVVAKVNPNGEWAEEQPFPYNGSGFSTGWPNISPDGNALYFASNRPDGFGGFDLYVSYRMGNTWSTPENLGPKVNSPGNEISPFFDGTAMFFSSDWHQGMGGYDIFRAEQANGRWERVFHLGNLVNSSRDDYGFVYDSFRNLGYMVSNRPGGRGNEDIYKVFKSADNITLNIKNASDGTPIPYATVDFINCGEGLFKADSRGIYSFQAVEGLNCDIVIRAEGYNDAVFKVATLGMRKNREQDIMLSRRGEEYVGKILSYTTRLPIAGVVVSTTNQATSSTMEASTDVNGDYALALSPNSTYIIRYSRPGYRDISRTVNTGDGYDRSILSVISMLPTAIDPGNVDPNSVGGTTTPPATKGSTGAPVINKGYAVQVAALSKPSLESFSGLTDLGQVYSKKEGNAYKVRIGVFTSRAEAVQALNSVKNRGYKGAFLVTEEGNADLTPKSVAPQGNSTPQGYDNIGASRIESQAGVYKVQLAAYKNPQYFDPTPIANLGTLEERTLNGLTVKYIAGFDDLEEAKLAWRRARAAGFDTAFIVQQAGNNLEKVYP
jgi:tetratricopeptide (TPR) repeat protein/cell division septation protein DedD